MSSFLCFICHSTVNSDTNEETRERYRDVVGMNLCPDSHLCHICCHVLNKLWLFKTVCLKRSLEYPVLFSEKGTLNLQRNDLEIHTLCSEDICSHYHNRNINSKSYHFHFNNYSDNYEFNTYDNTITHQDYNIINNYNISNQFLIEDERTDFDVYFNINEFETVTKEAVTFDCKYVQTAEDILLFVSKEVQTDIQYDFVVNSRIDEVIDDKVSIKSVNQEVNIEHKEINENNHAVEDNLDAYDEEYINNEQENVNVTDDIETDHNTIEFDQNNENNSPDNKTEELQENLEIKEENRVKKKHKSKKSKKKEFEKIVLTLKQQKAELEGKRKEKKYTAAEFKCYNCALGFLFKDTYQTHMMRHEESNGEYKCTVCTLRFATPAVLRSHNKSHTERYRCTRCDDAVGPQSRKTHARRCWNKFGDIVACHLCGGTFHNSNGLQQHLKRFHGPKTCSRTYSCNVCGKRHSNQAAVRKHMIKHINRKFNCDKCSSSFSNPYTLNQHRKKHETPVLQLHYCTICNVGYNSKKSLLAHRRNALNHQQTIFECPICSRVCPNQRSLASHIQTVHSTTKNYACPNCPARYSNRKSLVRHIGSHAGKVESKVAVCHLCGASFKGNNKLNRHLKQVCEKSKIEEEFSNLYDQACMNVG